MATKVRLMPTTYIQKTCTRKLCICVFPVSNFDAKKRSQQTQPTNDTPQFWSCASLFLNAWYTARPVARNLHMKQQPKKFGDMRDRCELGIPIPQISPSRGGTGDIYYL